MKIEFELGQPALHLGCDNDDADTIADKMSESFANSFQQDVHHELKRRLNELLTVPPSSVKIEVVTQMVITLEVW